MRRHQRALILYGLLVLGAAACIPQQPILIYVTPTPDMAAAVPTEVPTLEAAPAESPTPAPTGTDTPTSVPPSPLATFIGPVVGPEYTLPPTSTPRPTATPTEGPSPTPLATFTLAPPTETPAPVPGLDPNRIGIQLDPTLDQSDWNLALYDIQRLGIKWLKVQISWKMLQPSGPNDITEDFRRLEIYLENASNQGLNVLLSVAKAPDWARSTTVEDGPPNDPQALANFISLMLREFGQAITAIEVWNEPNLQREWQGQPLTGASYMNLFRPSYNAIRSYSPNIAIVTAGLAPTGNNLGSADDRTYLQQMYSAGLASFGDVAVGIHPYGWGNPPDARCCDFSPERGWDDDPHFFFLDNILDYRDIMVRNGHANAQLWVTEFGWATWDGLPGEAPEQWMTYNDRMAQARYTLRAFEIGQELGYVGPMILWNLNFAVLRGLVEQRDERAAYSLIVPLEPRERPLYWMLYDAVRGGKPS